MLKTYKLPTKNLQLLLQFFSGESSNINLSSSHLQTFPDCSRMPEAELNPAVWSTLYSWEWDFSTCMSCTCSPHSYQAFSAVPAQSLETFSSMQSTKIWAHIGKVSSFILSRFLQWAHYYCFGQEISSPNKIAFKTELALIGLKKNNVHANSQAPGVQAMGAPKLRLERPNYLCNNPKLQVCALPQLLECVGLRSMIFILHHETAFELQTLVCFAYSGAFFPASKSASQQQASPSFSRIG
jgi:hypothetical protein